MQAVDTSRKVFELPPDRLEIVIDKNLQPTDSAEDFCGLQHRSAHPKTKHMPSHLFLSDTVKCH